MITGLLLPAALILPALAFLIWASMGRGLKPLHRMAAALGRRGPEDLSPIPGGSALTDIRPMVDELNGLFGMGALARGRASHFTDFHPHELRHPLQRSQTQAITEALRAGQECA